jgi:hypothetical protein
MPRGEVRSERLEADIRPAKIVLEIEVQRRGVPAGWGARVGLSGPLLEIGRDGVCNERGEQTSG